MKHTLIRLPIIAFSIIVLNVCFQGDSFAQLNNVNIENNGAAFTIEDALNVRNVSIAAVTHDGQYVAATIRTHRDRLNVDHFRFGDPTYISPSLFEVVVINTETGREKKLFNEKVQVRSFSWSPDGKTLAFFLRKGDEYFLHMYDREKEKVKESKLKTKKSIASNSFLQWRPDGNGVLLALRAEGWAEKSKEKFRYLSEGPIIVQDSNEPFLAWDAVRGRSALQVLALADVKSREVKELLPETKIGGLHQSEDGTFITYVVTESKKTSYNRRDGAEYGVFMLNLNDTEPKLIREKSKQRFNPRWTKKGDMYAYAEKGNVFVQSVHDQEGKNLTKEHRTKISETDSSKLRYSFMRWSPDDKNLLVSSQKGYHLLDSQSGNIELVYELPEDKETAPTVNVSNWSPDGRYLYMTYSAKDKWERGLTKFDLRTKQMSNLVKDGNLYSSWRFSENGERIVYNFSNGDLPNNIYVADKDFSSVKQVTDLNPWLNERTLTKSELITYLNIDGKEMKGVLYYPVNYQPGKKYPLVAEVYERFFNNGFNHRMNLVANAGYFGFRPSVDLEIGFPGESWMKAVTTGINKLIDKGMVDGKKLGVHGTSYGGYAVNLLVTQTDRFAAAINISGKVNIISFLGDSPKITTRNYAAAEIGQDRIGATLWEQPQKYLAHTAILYADRIKTPLLLLSGEGDWNVPATNQREMYYALRRLGKEVVWVNYMRAGHGAGRAGTVDDFHDHWTRILDWYKTHFDKADEESGGTKGN